MVSYKFNSVPQVGTGDFAIRESLARIKIFKNFKEHRTIKAPISSSEGLFGGACVALKGPDCVVFFDWNEGAFLCKIDVAPKAPLSVRVLFFYVNHFISLTGSVLE
jgi:hypothetical protein